MENENKRFYLTIKGQEVEVSEEVYRAYIQPLRAERRRKQRAFRCKVKGDRLNLVRCKKDCRECPYAQSGHNALGNNLSLDRMRVDGVDIEDSRLNVEQNYIDKEENQELYAAISQLTPRQKELVEMIYFEGMSQEIVAQKLGIDSSSVRHAMQRIYASLRKILEKKLKNFHLDRHVFEISVLG